MLSQKYSFFGCSLNRNMMNFFAPNCVYTHVFVWILNTYFSSVPPACTWTMFVHLCWGLFVCKCACAVFFFFFAADASHCVKCRGLNLSSESNKGGRPLESNRQFLAQKRFKYFLSICGRKETHGRENNNKWSAALLFFFCHPSHVPSLVVPHCQTLFPH